MKPAYDRMMARVTVVGDCWLFTGASNGGSGHGQVRAKRNGVWKKDYAHRIAYEHAFGAIPEGMVVRHKCDTGNCVKPDHLELGTVAQNNADIMARKRGANQYGRFTSLADLGIEEEVCPF